MAGNTLVGKKLSRINLAVVEGAVSTETVRKRLGEKFNLRHITLESFESNREAVFKENQIVWIHIETRIHKEDITFLNHKSVLATTSTGSTHIANEVIAFLGNRFISLKTEPNLLNSITSTAELALTFLLMGLTNVETALSNVKKGNWSRTENLRKMQVSNSQVGIIGYGRLGSILGTYLRPLAREITVWDIDKKALARAKEAGLKTANSLEHLLSTSDAASIHVNALQGDGPIVTRNTLAKARPGIVLVNTSRGLLVSEDCILWGLENGVLDSYFSDVLKCEDTGEPVTASKLWIGARETTKVILTPHIGGASMDAIEKCEMNVAHRLESMFAVELL